MSFPAPSDSSSDWVTLPVAAARLGVHRTAVNSMILDGRIEAERHGPYWRIRRDVLEEYARTYQRPPNVPVPTRDPDALPPVAARALDWLHRWSTATTSELGEVMTDAPGNIRKATDILRSRGLAERSSEGVWSLTPHGRAFAKRHAGSLNIT